MKKFLLFVTTFLVLVSSIVFCGCKDKYDDLKIECNVSELNLVLDDNELKYKNMIFELSGSKEWGEVSIVSKPDGLFRVVDSIIDGKRYGVRIQALQPTGTGAYLEFTHLGSGKTCSVPLYIGRRLQEVSSKGNEFIVQLPEFKDGEETKAVEILTEDLLQCLPENYTDDIVWQASTNTLPYGVKVDSYDETGNITNAFGLTAGSIGPNFDGTSNAKKSVITLKRGVGACEFNISPISVLENGKAVYYSDVIVKVKLMNVLSSDNVIATSLTHSERIDEEDIPGSELLKELVLISNPHTVRGESVTGYNNYNTGLVELKVQQGDQLVEFDNEAFRDFVWDELYDIELSSNINDLLLESFDFGQFRVIASSTSFGEGEIIVKFKPKNCVGDIKAFEVVIPCTVGERPTSFVATNNNLSVDIDEVEENKFASINVPLNDSTSYGQNFNFEVLGTNTLSGLKYYRIAIDRNLLYINPRYVTEGKDAAGNDCKYSEFIREGDDSANYDLTEIVPYEYQISILRDGKEITFYREGGQLVSQPLTARNTIYIKWVRIDDGASMANVNFGITLSSYYYDDYDIDSVYYSAGEVRDWFDDLSIQYSITFNRQRTVESVNYIPVTVELSASGAVAVNAPDDLKDGWQFYFTPDMLTCLEGAPDKLFYGIKINSVKGLNNTELTGNELENINLDVVVNGSSFVNNCLGLKIFNKANVNPFELSTKFNYKSVLDPDANVIVLGKITDVAYGEYELNISQTNKPIASRNIKVYKTLTSDDISVSVPNADYDGEFLRYEKLTAKPTDFETNYASYYEYIGGRYVSVTNKTWSESKAYYTKQFVDAYTKLLEKPEDFETNYSAYYIYDVTSGTYIPVSVGTWADDVEYYKKSNIEFIDTLIDSNNTYILSTSSTYDVNVEIEGDAFVSVASKSATAEFVDSYQLLTVEPADFTTSYADYYKWEGAYIQLTSEETFVEGKYYKKLDVLKTNLNNMAQTSTSKDEIVTGVNGTFNTVTGVKNYVKITYTITPTKYDYYQISKTSGIPQTKSIYVYVYEPLQTATFNKTMLYKYAYSYQDANREYLLGSLREELGTEQLKIEINGSSETSALNYVDIMWMRLSDGVEIRPQNDITSATYQFNTIRGESVSGTIYAVITQFGTQFSIQCGYHVSNPILTERVMLNTPSQTFKTGGAYINMKLGDELEIDAEQHSSLGDVTVDELNYITCNVSGAQSDGIISYDAGSGKLVANNAGRAKLVIVSTDALKETLYSGLNYLNKSTYVRADALDCVLIIDIIVSDGSEENPYLIATADDFRKIKDDFVAKEEHGWRPEYDENNYLLNGVNNKHYALTENVDIKGKPIQFSGDFAGSVVSYQEREGVNNRFTVYGVMLTESNSTLFTNVTKEAKMENLTFHIDINYNRTTIPSSDILIGLIGKNAGQINNVISVVSGKINDNVSRAVSYSNFDYTIGALIAHNKGDVTIDDVTLVGVKGDIIVNTPNSSVVLGGLIGKNEGNIIGAHTGAKQNTSTGKVEYEVYYDNQGATADVVLQVKSAKSEGAIGGVIGYNIGSSRTENIDGTDVITYNGIVTNIYSTGQVLGVDDAGNLVVNNVGGLIGKNESDYNVKSILTLGDNMYHSSVGSVKFDNDAVFQINNCYSTAQVYGNDNVGGVVGSDDDGSYYKVYYEIYKDDKVSIKGNNNVGGLIGYGNDSNLYYCYAQNFAWNYSNTVENYNLVASGANVGGLIGYAVASDVDYNEGQNNAVNIVSSSASINISANGDNVAGLVGKIEKCGTITVSYYYGVVEGFQEIEEADRTKLSPYIANVNNGLSDNNLAYNNVYTIINGAEWAYVNEAFTTDISSISVNGFERNEEYNNGRPYIVITDKDGGTTNLVTIMPSIIEIDTAIEVYFNYKKDNNGVWIYEHYEENVDGEYVYINNMWIKYDSEDTNHDSLIRYNKAFGWTKYTSYEGHQGVQRYSKNAVYEQNDYGEYVEIDGEMVYYDLTNLAHKDRLRYTIRARLIDAEDNLDKTNYRNQAILMYYYQFADTSGEYAIQDMYGLNTINIRDIIADDGIILIPETIKRFSVKSSNTDVVRVLTNGELLLRGDGQAIITITSVLNSNVSASFVIVVRKKVLDFNLYSNANLREEYKITSDTTISIVNGSSKIIESDYTYNVMAHYGREYECVPADNMELDFIIEYFGSQTIDDISTYITLNGSKNGNIYTISNNESIMISVHKYVEGKFVITATPYLIATYKDTDENITVNRFALDCFTRSFNVITKKGASAVNADRTQIDMMPSDEPSNLELKISTDDQVKELHFEIIDITSASGTNNATYVEGLDILFKNEKQTGSIDISSIDVENVMQTVNLTLRLNKNSHYIEQGYILQVRFYVLNGDKQIEEIIHINVLPQIISSVIPLNYRMEDGETEVNFKNAYESGVIRPGSTNIITIDIVPNIAVYDYVEVRDITGNDKILFQQVDEKLQSLENMDSWVDNGIKLIKVKENDSRLYLIAKLPLNSTYNITHTIQITIYQKVGEPIVTNLSLEAIMYPTIVMTYNDPTGKQIAKADTREGSKQEIEQNANLALGVEAPISVEAYNIDEGSLQNSIKITNAESNEVANSNYVYLDYIYGKYVLRFNTSSKTAWVNLLGCNISVTFTASKHLNGITETCKATITFTIREVVVHGVSMTHSTIQDGMEKLYGDWSVISDEGNIEYWFETQFYFDRNDISFYNNGYWNVKYNLDNTANIYYINRILKDINSLTNGVELYLGEENITNIVKSSNGYVGKNFIIKHEADRLKIMAYKDSDINNMKLSINFTFGYEGNNPILKSNGDYTISEEFGFIITDKSTPFDQYLKVSTPEEFVNMIEGKYYQLVNDITFDDEYTPLNTAISALNGNGYTITIKKFNVSQLVQDYVGGGMYIGLFGTQTENTIIQNLQVKYEDVIVSLIENETIKEQYSNEIFYGGISAINLGVITNVNVEGTFRLLNEIVPSAQIDLGGITASNGSAQSTKLATITNSTSAINLNSIALIGGVAGTNYGKITNTVFSGTISNMNMDSTGNAFASTVFTAGFVVENIAGANISLSYVDCDNTSNTTINSVGNTAGFVYNNAGTINNSYIVNTSIKSQGNIAGFAYQSSGTIDCCYSYTTIPSSLFYQEFIYLTSNVGSLSNCYVITDSSRTITISGLKAIKISESSNKDKYQGFVLTDNINGVWIMRENYPVILSAGVELLSDHDYTNIYNIYDVETYQGYFDMFITTSGETSSSMLDKTFRIVRNIDFANTQIGNPMTSNINLIANLEGNDMEISNYSIYKDGTIENIGLFATINRDVYVRNLILKPESIKATSGKAVGALAGEIDGAYIFNIKIDNNSLLILGKNSVGGLAGLIKGAFEIAGINSNVSAFATYKYNTANQYNLYTGKNVTGSEVDNLDIVSYAGSIAGIINGYNENALFSASNRNKENYSKIYHLKVEGSLVLIGETVGALFGLVGEQTFVYNSSYIVEEETQYQAEFVSGGLVGENRGVVQNCNITPSNISLSANENCFKYNATVNGGIAGLNIGGLINNCSSSLNITNNHTTATVGGIVGRNIEGLVWECSIDAYMSGFYAGGIVGTDYSYSTIIKIKTGYGTATDASVYKNIKSTVSYKASNNEDENTPFIGNKISKQFIQNFLNVSKTYYQFNSGYVTGEELNLVNADKAFGLFIGVTDRVNVKVDNVVYGNNILTATISSGDNPIRYSDYILEYNGLEEKKKYSVEAVTDIVDGTFNLSGLYIEGGTPATFVYLVAKEGVAYEGWSPALGYGKQRVIIASNSFGTWIESEAFITGNSYEDNTYLVLVNDVYIAVNNLYYTADNLKTEDESATKGFGYYDKETLEVTLVADGTKLYKWQ